MRPKKTAWRKKWKVVNYQGLNHTPAVRLAREGLVDLPKDSALGEIVALNWDYKALVAFDSDKHGVGVLIYEIMDWKKEIVVVFGYTRPTYQRRGIYRALWKELLKIARAKNIPTIMGGTWSTNYPMKQAMRAFGRREVTTLYRYDVAKKA